MSTNSITTFLFARDKTWTYNLNIFSVPLYQLSFSSYQTGVLPNAHAKIFTAQAKLGKGFVTHKKKKVSPMEISGLDPEITICKIAVLPIKLYPL